MVEFERELNPTENIFAHTDKSRSTILDFLLVAVDQGVFESVNPLLKRVLLARFVFNKTYRQIEPLTGLTTAMGVRMSILRGVERLRISLPDELRAQYTSEDVTNLLREHADQVHRLKISEAQRENWRKRKEAQNPQSAEEN